MKVKTIEKERIYLVTCDIEYKLAFVFMRLQEHYESKKYAGKFFSWEEYMDYYAKENGKFSYLEDHDGFNIPSHVLEPFYKGKFDPLMNKEKRFLDIFSNKDRPFAIIGMLKPKGRGKIKETILKHEFLHGLFYLYPEYKRKVIACLAGFSIKKVKKALSKMGYNRKVHNDEANAYILTDVGALKTIKSRNVKKLKRALLKIFIDCFGYDITKQRSDFFLERIHQISL